MSSSYSKQCTLPSDLIPLLRGRGLVISNEPQAENYLWGIGYFRFSAYLRPLYREPKSKHLFKDNASFEQALNMYRFDRKLRLLLFNEIERIEVAIRSALVNIVSDGVRDVFWMTNARYFYNSNVFNNSLGIIDTELGRTKEEFVLHFKNTYSDAYPPAWMIAEILPLGVICSIYRNINNHSLRKKVAKHFGLTTTVFESWILTLAILRNLCCHHARVWNKDLVVRPTLPQSTHYSWIDTSKTDIKRVYIRICMIKYLLCSVSPMNKFTDKIKGLIAEYPNIDIRAMGFPADWEAEPLWI
jgi:Abortive infection bacteriophage resistance protein